MSDFDATPTVAPYTPSDQEKTTRDTVSTSPSDYPGLLYRSDLIENIPPAPTEDEVPGTPFRQVWQAVLPQISKLMKAQNINYTSISPYPFSGNGTMELWIMIRPGTTTAEQARSASQDILALLKANGVNNGVMIDWSEGVVQKLVDKLT